MHQLLQLKPDSSLQLWPSWINTDFSFLPIICRCTRQWAAHSGWGKPDLLSAEVRQMRSVQQPHLMTPPSHQSGQRRSVCYVAALQDVVLQGVSELLCCTLTAGNYICSTYDNWAVLRFCGCCDRSANHSPRDGKGLKKSPRAPLKAALFV